MVFLVHQLLGDGKCITDCAACDLNAWRENRHYNTLECVTFGNSDLTDIYFNENEIINLILDFFY